MNGKRLIVNIAANIASFVVSFAISFFLTPYIIETLGKEAYGFLDLGNQFIIYATIVTSALNSMASRFITIEIVRGNKEKRNQYFSTLVLSNIVISLVLLLPCVIVVLFLEKIVSIPLMLTNDVKILWAFLFFNFLVTLVMNSYSVAAFSTNRLYLNSIRSTIGTLIKALILIGVFSIFTPHLWFLGLAALLCTVYVVAYNVYYSHKFFPDMTCDRHSYNKNCLKDLLSSGIWNSFSQLASVLNNGLDLLISNLLISASAMGTMSVSKLLTTYYVQIIPMFSNVFLPELTKNFAQNNKEQLLSNIDFGRKITAFFSAIYVGIMLSNGDIFFKLWVPGENANQLHLIAVSGLIIYLFVGSLTTLADAFIILDKQKYVSITYFIAGILNVVIVFLFLKFIDFENIALNWIDAETLKLLIVSGVSGLIAIIRNVTFTPLYASKCMGVKWYYFYPTMLRSIVATLSVVAIAYGIRNLMVIDSWITFIISSAIACVIGAAVMFFVLFTREQRKLLFGKIKLVLSKSKKET